MGSALVILLVLVIYIGIPAAIGFAIVGGVVLATRPQGLGSAGRSELGRGWGLSLPERSANLWLGAKKRG